MKSQMKFVVLALLSALLLASFTSAACSTGASNVLEICTNNVPSTIVQGQSQVVSFNVTYTGTGNNVELDFSDSTVSSSQASWSNSFLTNTPTINEGETITITATLTANSQATGSITDATINVKTAQSSTETLTLSSISILTTTDLEILVDTPTVRAGQNATIRVRNNGNNQINGISLTEVTNFGTQFTPSSLNLAPGITSNTVSVITELTRLVFGDNSVRVRAASGTASDEAIITVQKSFCDNPTVTSNLTIKDVEISNDGDGEDDEWELLDEVRVEINVENTGSDDIDSAIVLGLFDSDGTDLADDLNYLSSSEGEDEKIEIQIDEDEDVDVTFEFTVPADFDVGNYKLTVKAYDDDAGEDEDCTDVFTGYSGSSDLYEEVGVNNKDEEEDSIAVDDFDFPAQVACGETFSGSFGLFNVGGSSEDRVRVEAKNTQLGVNEAFEITNFDDGDDARFNLEFEVPNNIRDGTYNIEFIPFFDYSRGNYDETGNSYTYPIRVSGCAGGSTGGNGQVSVSANLDSEAVAGELLTITLSVTNTGTTTQNFVIEPINYQSWAEIDSISERSVDLAPGQTRQIIVRLNIDESASGNEDFAVNVISGGRVFTQPLEVNIEGNNGSSVGNIFAGWFQGNSLVWAIAIINIVLIVLIIVVAIRVARR